MQHSTDLNCQRCNKAILFDDPDKVVIPHSNVLEKSIILHGECVDIRAEPLKAIIYLITFTKKGEVDLDKWKTRIKFELKRKHILKFKAAVEHEADNIHVHALCETSRTLKKIRDFKTFTNHYGFVDLKFVKKDNGIGEYIAKDSDPVSTVGDLFA